MTEGQEMAQRTRQATNNLSREERGELLQSGLEQIKIMTQQSQAARIDAGQWYYRDQWDLDPKLGNKSVDLETSCDHMAGYISTPPQSHRDTPL